MRAKQIRLILTVVVIVIAFIGMIIPREDSEDYSGIASIASNVKLGLDIQGGSLFEYNLDLEGDMRAQDMIDNVILVLRNRLDAAGYTEAIVSRIVSGGQFRVRVEIPGITDTARAEELIGSRGRLFFGEVIETTRSDVQPRISRARTITIGGRELPTEIYVRDSREDDLWYRVKTYFDFGREPFEITGADVTSASAGINPDSPGFMISLNFSRLGADKFATATGNLIGERMAIVLDEVAIIAPTVRDRIPGGQARIDGIQNVQEARNIAALIEAGNLPVDLLKFQERSLGPTLGRDIVNTIIKAGIVGLIIVMIYIIVFYGWMGVIADIAIIYNGLLLMGVLSWTGAILTLPGIAGIILTFGTTVDGNIIIYERIKEELRMGRPPLTAVKFGFSKAFSTLFDANLTTIIAGVILYYFSTGAVRGFAITLIIGVLGALFTNLVVSRTVLTSTAHLINAKKYHTQAPEAKEAK